MRRMAVLALSVALVIGGLVTDGEAGRAGGSVPDQRAAVFDDRRPVLRNHCERLYPVKRVHGYIRGRYRGRARPLTLGQKRYIRRMQRCMYSARKARRARALQRRLRAGFRARLAYYRLTPFVCGRARWAIPCSIVYCESHGSWSAYNPSGARGPYQLLGWPVPWPVRSWGDRLAHHRMAARLWSGGRGRSHWVC